MRKIILLALFITLTVICGAKEIKTYSMKMPAFVFEGVKTVFVKDITVEDAEDWNAKAGKTLTKLIKENINNAKQGAVKGYESTLPWINTKLYDLVGSEGEADLVISGSIRSNLVKNSKESMKGKFQTPVHKIPYFVKAYERKKEASASLDLYFTNKSGVSVKTYSKLDMSYTFSKEYLGAPKLTSTGDYEGEIPDSELTLNCISDYLKSIKAELTPHLVIKTYDVKKVKKIKDKALAKKQKEAYKLSKKSKYSEAADLFSEAANGAADKRAVQMAAKNSGILYMLTGNLEKADRYIQMTGDKKLVDDLMKLKALHQQLQNLGRL